MHADDLVEWMMTIALHASTDCPVYNVGSDQAVHMGDLAKLVANEFGVDVCIPEITDVEVDSYIPSIEKAKYELGLTFQNDLNSAIRNTVLRLSW